jgi:hypothetical protein
MTCLGVHASRSQVSGAGGASGRRPERLLAAFDAAARILWRLRMDRDEDLVMVEVVNATAEEEYAPLVQT